MTQYVVTKPEGGGALATAAYRGHGVAVNRARRMWLLILLR